MLDNESLHLDEKKLNMMKVAILTIEKDNGKTRERTSDGMVESIRKIIVDEVKKRY